MRKAVEYSDEHDFGFCVAISHFCRMNQNLTEAEIREGAVILIDKDLRWTSFDAINKFKRTTHAKIGHCGTLDPLATGLLICCTGRMTKSISEFQKQDKEYSGIIHLGFTTPTYDLESAPENPKSVEHLTEEEILAAAQTFVGTIQQVPPAHSAIKQDGKRLYELARAGKEVEIKPREVQIHSFEISKIELPLVHFKVLCSTGTYIRSLANDFGEKLDVGGYLKALRRTKIGGFSVDDARTIDEWLEYLSPMTFVRTPKQRPTGKKKKNFEE